MARTVEEIFRQFHGIDPSEKVKLKVAKPPKDGALLGRLKSFTYETLSDGSVRAGKLYEHEVGDTGSGKTGTEYWVIADKKGHIHFVPVHIGGGAAVNERGIVG